MDERYFGIASMDLRICQSGPFSETKDARGHQYGRLVGGEHAGKWVRLTLATGSPRKVLVGGLPMEPPR